MDKLFEKAGLVSVVSLSACGLMPVPEYPVAKFQAREKSEEVGAEVAYKLVIEKCRKMRGDFFNCFVDDYVGIKKYGEMVLGGFENLNGKKQKVAEWMSGGGDGSDWKKGFVFLKNNEVGEITEFRLESYPEISFVLDEPVKVNFLSLAKLRAEKFMKGFSGGGEGEKRLMKFESMEVKVSDLLIFKFNYSVKKGLIKDGVGIVSFFSLIENRFIFAEIVNVKDENKVF